MHTHTHAHTRTHTHATHLYPCPSSHVTLPAHTPQVAAQSLQEVADEFQEEGNIIITVAKKMSQQMSQMAEFSHGRGELQVLGL